MMITRLLFFVIFITVQLCCDELDHKIPVFQAYLFNQDGTPTDVLVDVIDILNVAHDGTAASIVRGTQKLWFTGKEYCEIEENKHVSKETLIFCLQQLGLWDEKSPQPSTHYEGVIVPDAHYFDWQVGRIKFLHNLACSKSDMTNKVYFCKSANQMHPISVEKLETLMDPFCSIIRPYQYSRFLMRVQQHNEQRMSYTTNDCVGDMVSSIFQRPFAMNEQRIDVVSGMHPDNTRPNTMDNALNFLTLNPEDGRYVVVSNQPHAHYQEITFALAALRAGRSLEFESVGSAAFTYDEDDLNTGQQLDRLTRLIYAEWEYVQEYQKVVKQINTVKVNSSGVIANLDK